MKVELTPTRLEGYLVREYGKQLVGRERREREWIELDEKVVQEYAGIYEVYLEAFAAFERAIEEAQEIAAELDLTEPDIE